MHFKIGCGAQIYACQIDIRYAFEATKRGSDAIIKLQVCMSKNKKHKRTCVVFNGTP